MEKADDTWVVTRPDGTTTSHNAPSVWGQQAHEIVLGDDPDVEYEWGWQLNLLNNTYKSVDTNWTPLPEGFRVQHVMGGCLMRVRHADNPRRFSYLLCGMDTSSNIGRGFFLVRCPGRPVTLDAAYDSLRPDDVPADYNERDDWVRQGEFYFHRNDYTTANLSPRAKQVENISYRTVDCAVDETQRDYLIDMPFYERVAWVEAYANVFHSVSDGWEWDGAAPILKRATRDYYDADKLVFTDCTLNEFTHIRLNLTRTTRSRIHKGVDLSSDLAFGNGGNSHTATDCILTEDGEVYVRKTVRHPEHRMVTLGNEWHRVYINRAAATATTPAMWNSRGGVD